MEKKRDMSAVSGATIRERTLAMEVATLSPMATLASKSKGRARFEEECPVRTVFQRDRDRVVHSKAFRRLKDKTQVFVAAEGDHFRTRLTHTLEVCQIARTIARGIGLNEDLTEAIALAHDLGHTPFGHAGENVLDRLHPGGFAHEEQSLRVVDVLESGGLNLTWEVRDGILNHPWKRKPATAEGKCIQLADRIAYVNHDIDDAIRGDVIRLYDLPAEALDILGTTHGRRINALVTAAITQSLEAGEVTLIGEPLRALNVLRVFLFDKVYIASSAKREEEKAKGLVETLYLHYCKHPEILPDAYKTASGLGAVSRDLRRSEAASDLGVDACGEVGSAAVAATSAQQAACDYVAGMTDRYAIAQYMGLFVPKTWNYEET